MTPHPIPVERRHAPALSDFYAGRDLLADVFPGTEDAPKPLIRRNCAGGLQSLWANPEDPRWHVTARLYGDGEIAWIDDRSVRFREVS